MSATGSRAPDTSSGIVAARGGSFLIEERRVDEVFTPEDFTEEQRMIGRTALDFKPSRARSSAAGRRRRAPAKTRPAGTRPRCAASPRMRWIASRSRPGGS